MSIEYVAMNISELSKLSGLSTPTIRYYEQIKLLPKAKESRMVIVNIPITT